ncbi:MAG: hypothetical protein DK304_000413 [Chloroflexi bacterium]|jgi:transcriptional regulator of heat shock response|nr:MAG: hypothetical protein DK304_000413 [Chloroflexota bacterium]
MVQSVIELIEGTGIMPEVVSKVSDAGSVKGKIGREHAMDKLRNASVTYSRYV